MPGGISLQSSELLSNAVVRNKSNKKRFFVNTVKREARAVVRECRAASRKVEDAVRQYPIEVPVGSVDRVLCENDYGEEWT